MKKLITYIINGLFRLCFLLLLAPFKIFSWVNQKKRRYIPFYSFIFFLCYITLVVKTSGDPLFSTHLPNNIVNDVTQLNPIQVAKIIRPKSDQEIVDAIKNSSGPISIGGGKFSQGGQTAFENSLHIDMRSFNQLVSLDTNKKRVTVQAGITWRDLQQIIDPHNLSIKIMQTYANFTVGGAISVNCHGRYIGHGPIISSVLDLKMILADGSIIHANRNENPTIFAAVVGGYGGIGIISEATLQLEDNVRVKRKTTTVSATNYYSYFKKNIRNNKKVIFQNGDLYPPNYDEVMNVSWEQTDETLTTEERITPKDKTYWLMPKLAEVVSWGNPGKWIRRNIFDPIVFSSDAVVLRNKEASYDVKELEPNSRDESTYVLQEYFIPVENFGKFIPKMKEIFNRNNANIINVSIRHALPDTISYLTWAPSEVFAFVIYHKQGTSATDKSAVKKWTVEMTDAILSVGGTWYLPYQPHATYSQFIKGYPKSFDYFRVKNEVDPSFRFTNKLLDKYRPIKSNIAKQKQKIKDYHRPEEQTILTVPEWYLVYNPKEYADYLEAKNSPSDFPFYESINEYWSLYDKSVTLTKNSYANNDEYLTMLQVIGISMTMEFCIKHLYEKTIGSFFELFSNNSISEEDIIIQQAHRAYSDFIYNTAWYEFEFMPWVKKIWTNTPGEDDNVARQWERKIAFSIEFTVKAFYAKLIEWGAKSSYDKPCTDIYLTVKSKNNLSTLDNVTVIESEGENQLISIPRWGVFTETLINHSNKDIYIMDISGNDLIVVSVLHEKNYPINYHQLTPIYNSNLVTNSKQHRSVLLMNVKNLISFINYCKNHNIAIEHIYDY